MIKQTTCYCCDKPIEPEWLPEGEFIVCDECSSDTDKLSAEKLQEQLNTAKNALTDIIFFSQACYDSEYFASIAQKALAEIIGNDEK
ncbi:hypothetical protein LLAPH_281_0038 [Lactococcus phage ASCC281]|uniref:Prophage protein n=7 Tax=Skunavirus TaxID=1623305 RepID=H9EEQ9_9CAUD|nr:hypothetical protein LLAPH_532_0039 [Lactococcus phage ASCC532]YP_006201969.1 hypothetical protein LLAPH_281_0038 [Lactococcus phage ASCC281]AFE86946.1 hypothetical protein LLAPH_284_0038 [Lactococcus phage ASCC284]AFE87061.1 hypothetical protein LLAPH_310_0038 [Lactococcus phage ASCC310]AFE87232.1 hypothetical protein LLAPH_356_0038 [Lactococcus phage ASCC356]AFE87286.1 hypothetical protein LLAPH_358_0038 [Lactococcus phage ASCC358]AFE87343.1 hypothetical protein LLAPH_365_0038 [Lactococc